MKRTCNLCLKEHRYDKVKAYGPHKVQLCNYCMDVIYFYVADNIERYGL